jgi:hypothetical protein
VFVNRNVLSIENMAIRGILMSGKTSKIAGEMMDPVETVQVQTAYSTRPYRRATLSNPLKSIEMFSLVTIILPGIYPIRKI